MNAASCDMTDYPIVLRNSDDIVSYKWSTKSEKVYVSKSRWGRHLSRKRVPKKLAERTGLSDPRPVIVVRGTSRADAFFMFESSCGCMASDEELSGKVYIPSPSEIAGKIAAIRAAPSEPDGRSWQSFVSTKDSVSTEFFEADRYPHDDAQLCDCPYWMHELLD
jgi:hypothetical protein